MTFRSILASALLVGALASVTGCSASQLNQSCVHTKIELHPVALDSQISPVTLPARLTGDGKPLPNFRLSFFLTFAGPTALVGTSGKLDDQVGYAMTDSSGVARLLLPGGPASQALPNEYAVGYAVSLTLGNPINGRYYCGSHASASFT